MMQEQIIVNTGVKNVVLVSTRWIPNITLLDCKDYDKYLRPSLIMASYFCSLVLKNEDGFDDEDEISSWLNSQMVQSSSGETIGELLEKMISKLEVCELGNLTVQGQSQSVIDLLRDVQDPGSLELAKADILDGVDESYKSALQAFFDNPEFQLKKTNGYWTLFNKDLDFLLSGRDISHLDKPEGQKLVKHRLGIYTRAEGKYAFCSIWPWAGSTEDSHDDNWKTVLIKTVKEHFPNTEDIILILHDADFIKYNGKDEVIESRIIESRNSPPIKYHLAVFQHNNDVVSRILKCENIEMLYSEFDNNVGPQNRIKQADSGFLNSKAHDIKQL